jgi:hypothetical protein
MWGGDTNAGQYCSNGYRFPIGLRMLRMLEAILEQTREEMGERWGRE